jgi:hypothetical protein
MIMGLVCIMIIAYVLMIKVSAKSYITAKPSKSLKKSYSTFNFFRFLENSSTEIDQF